MVGSAIARQIARRSDLRPLTRSRAELDLTDQAAVRDFFRSERPDLVILAAAKVGGIGANSAFPAQFLYENLMIEANVIHEAFRSGVGRLLFLGSSCIYPRDAPQPIAESALLTGALEPTNEAYAIAKIAGIKLCESYNRQYGADFRSVMPCNLYGPRDDFLSGEGHVLPTLLHRFHLAARSGAETVTIWGTGQPRREFLHVDDLAAAALFVLDLPASVFRATAGPRRSHVNVGSGRDLTIRELAEKIAEVTGFRGRILTDPGRPDGTPRKLVDVSRLGRLGWQARIGLEEGLRQTYAAYLNDLFTMSA